MKKLYEFRDFNFKEKNIDPREIIGLETESGGSCIMLTRGGLRLENIARIDVVRNDIDKMIADYETGAPLKTAETHKIIDALNLAALTFRHYEQLHRAKPDHEKADRNKELAEVMEYALMGQRKPDNRPDGSGLDDGPLLPLSEIMSWKRPYIVKAWKQGLSLRDVGLIFDVSHETVAQFTKGMQR